MQKTCDSLRSSEITLLNTIPPSRFGKGDGFVQVIACCCHVTQVKETSLLILEQPLHLIDCQPDLLQHVLGDVSAVVGDLLKNGFLKPDIHLRVITADLFSGAAEFSSQLFAGFQAAVKPEEFQ